MGFRAEWSQRKTRLNNSSEFEELDQKISRSWSIETGVIEGLHHIPRGVTNTLIEHGIKEIFFDGNSSRDIETRSLDLRSLKKK
jgi:hypothetical protein